MRWHLEWGGKDNQELFKNVRKGTGRPHPAELRKPALRADCVKYLDAFGLLSASRVWNETGPQAIALSEVDVLVKAMGITEPSTQMKYVRLMKRMDEVELAHLRNKRSQQMAARK